MYTKEEITEVFKNCKTIHEVLKTCRIFKDLHDIEGHPLYNIQYLSLVRINKF